MKKEEKTPHAFRPGFRRDIDALQRRVAEWLNHRCENLSANMLMAIFIIFCAMTGLYCLSLIFGLIN